MKATLNYIKTIFQNPKYVYIIGFLIAVVATVLEVGRGRAENFVDYSDATINFWNGISSYTEEYVEAHLRRYYIYSPVFNVLFAPFAFLPRMIGALLYNLMNYTLFFFAIKNLPGHLNKYWLKIFLYLLLILEESLFCFQYNVPVICIFLWAYILLEKNHNFWAVFLIMLSATTKVYGAVELGLLLCYPKFWKNFGYAILCGMFFLLLPAIQTGFDGLIPWYADWVNALNNHQQEFKFISIIYVDPLAKWFMPNIRIVQGISFSLLLVGFFLSYKRWKDFNFRLQALAVMMGWLILFGDCSETHTYVIALSGFMMCYYTWKKHFWYDEVLYWMCFLTFMIIPSDVFCPSDVHWFINRVLWVNVYCFALVWLKMVYVAMKPTFVPESASLNEK